MMNMHDICSDLKRLLSAPLVCRIGEKLLLFCPLGFFRGVCVVRTAGALHRCKGNSANDSEVCRFRKA